MTKYLGEPSLKEELTKHKEALTLAQEEILLLRTKLQLAETNEKLYQGLSEHALDMIMRFAPDMTHLYSSEVKERLLSILANKQTEKAPNEIEFNNPEHTLITNEIKYKVLSINLQDKLQELSLSNFKLNEANQKLYSTQHELKQLNLAKDKLFSIISHDMKNPIAAIWTSCELLLQYLENNNIELAKAKGNRILEGIEHINQMLNDLLQWSMLQMGLISYQPEHVDVFDLTENCLSQIAIQAELKNITLRNETPKTLKTNADPRMLRITLGNLLSNAVKFTEAGGKIVIHTQRNDDVVSIEVRDTGIGIPEEKLSQIFEVAEKKSSAGTQNEKGTGLGLLICKDFISKHGGTITVQSELAQGSTFTINIPHLKS